MGLGCRPWGGLKSATSTSQCATLLNVSIAAFEYKNPSKPTQLHLCQLHSMLTMCVFESTRPRCAGCARRCGSVTQENSAWGSSTSKPGISWRPSGRAATRNRPLSCSAWASKRSCCIPSALKRKVHKRRLIRNSSFSFHTQLGGMWECSGWCFYFRIHGPNCLTVIIKEWVSHTTLLYKICHGTASAWD